MTKRARVFYSFLVFTTVIPHDTPGPFHVNDSTVTQGKLGFQHEKPLTAKSSIPLSEAWG